MDIDESDRVEIDFEERVLIVTEFMVEMGDRKKKN